MSPRFEAWPTTRSPTLRVDLRSSGSGSEGGPAAPTIVGLVAWGTGPIVRFGTEWLPQQSHTPAVLTLGGLDAAPAAEAQAAGREKPQIAQTARPVEASKVRKLAQPFVPQ